MSFLYTRPNRTELPNSTSGFQSKKDAACPWNFGKLAKKNKQKLS